MTINAYAVMGGIKIIVPPSATVHVDGVGIMGVFEHKNPRAGADNGPRIRITGFSFWGGVEVQQL